ncbi:ankyrin repeat protein [Seminavis robusta]|uniref:Ankyrin repeat protein n=1 Tax=Seminavis robusta TaxID=568900 RepID=A0A9N8F0T2_9STRA|nr:ankyrin repeat protein [Seminavis robusta]|eukprot:Sro2662_g333990.1 ankyrin repeat protein (321) ;mRNA; f:1241-2288
MLQWLREQGCPLNESVCSFAAKNGHLETLKWARANGCPWSSSTLWCAAAGGHLETLQWAHENGCPWSLVVSRDVVAGGHFELLKWAHNHGCPWDASTIYEIAIHGNLKMLEWAQQRGCPWHVYAKRQLDMGNWKSCSGRMRMGVHRIEELANLLLEGGHLGILQWAYENGCPWDETTCAAAARGGHFEILKWAHQNGCPWDTFTVHDANAGGHLEIVRWARQNGCPEGVVDTDDVSDSSVSEDQKMYSDLSISWLLVLRTVESSRVESSVCCLPWPRKNVALAMENRGSFRWTEKGRLHHNKSRVLKEAAARCRIRKCTP